MTWTLIAVMAAGAYGLKVAGLFGLSRVELRGSLASVVRFLPAALFASLVVQQTISTGSTEIMVTRALGVAAGGVAAWRKAPLLVVIVVGAGVAAGFRAIW